MRVNRVFCYSKEVAKQNGNKLPILALILSTILGMVVFVGLAVIMGDSFDGVMFTLVFIVWLSLIIYYSIILGLRLRSRMTGYATDTEGRIQCHQFKELCKKLYSFYYISFIIFKTYFYHKNHQGLLMFQ